MLMDYIAHLISLHMGLSEHMSKTLVVGSGILLSACLIALLLGPITIKLLVQYRIRLLGDRPSCGLLNRLHAHKKRTPIMGGLLIIFAIVFSFLIWGGYRNLYGGVLLFVLLMGSIVGFLDDHKKVKDQKTAGISAKRKLLVQGFIGLIVAFFALVSPGEQEPQGKDHIQNIKTVSSFIKKPEFSLQLPGHSYSIKIPGYIGAVTGLLFIVFVLTGTSNAVNLTDGLDGLATGTLIFCAIPLMVAAFLSQKIAMSQGIVFVYGSPYEASFFILAALVGASLGFLRYNVCPARVFMGDCGSLSLGAVLAAATIIIKQELLLAIVGIVFLVEALSVIIQVFSLRYRKKRIFLCAPLHHHFEYKGIDEKRVVLYFWKLGALAAIIGLVILVW